jgi:hypothetical protein
MVLSFDLDPLTSIIARYWGCFRRNQHFVYGPIFAQNFGDNRSTQFSRHGRFARFGRTRLIAQSG